MFADLELLGPLVHFWRPKAAVLLQVNTEIVVINSKYLYYEYFIFLKKFISPLDVKIDLNSNDQFFNFRGKVSLSVLNNSNEEGLIFHSFCSTFKLFIFALFNKKELKNVFIDDFQICVSNRFSRTIIINNFLKTQNSTLHDLMKNIICKNQNNCKSKRDISDIQNFFLDIELKDSAFGNSRNLRLSKSDFYYLNNMSDIVFLFDLIYDTRHSIFNVGPGFNRSFCISIT